VFVVGLTGGIGSGKSTVANCFAALGVTVIDADIAARVVVEPETDALQQITSHFGDAILLADGALNRSQLRTVIFNQANEKQWLESLLHPLIAKEIARQIQTASSDYCLFVSPLLLETSQHQLCDKILVVDTSEYLQIQRTLSRDSSNEEEVRRIIASQISRQDRLDKADDVLENSGDLTAIDAAVSALHQRYLRLAQSI
jgi:dephospho-CoA kinase